MLQLKLVLILFSLSFHSALRGEQLTLYTEEFPPFNYTQDSKHTGAATEIVKAVMVLAKQDYVIKSYPWARSYHASQTEKNALIYSISRRQKREPLFKWIGIIAPANQSVFALRTRTDININNLNEMKKYTIGTTIEDARESYLVAKGFNLSQFERVGGNSAYQLQFWQLMRGRIDLWPMPNAVMNYVVKDSNEDPKKVIKNVFPLKEISQEGYYIAASLSTSDEVVDKLKKALNAFKKTEDYRQIIKKWGL